MPKTTAFFIPISVKTGGRSGGSSHAMNPVAPSNSFAWHPDVRITRLDIHLAGDGPEGTIATWTQTMTALSPEGNSYIDRYGDSSYSQEIKIIEDMLNHYLQTGTMLNAAGTWIGNMRAGYEPQQRARRPRDHHQSTGPPVQAVPQHPAVLRPDRTAAALGPQSVQLSPLHRADRQRLEKICHYRRIGLSLKAIQQILDSPDDSLKTILEQRLREVDRQIQALRNQQRSSAT